MSNYNDISIRSAASFRSEARAALKGKWKSALLIYFVLMLIGGSIIGAGCTYYTSTETTPYWTLEASIGPFYSYSAWKDGALYKDYASTASDFFLLP